MPVELFFDIEVDPMRDICYLHGFVERRNGDNGTERFVSFFADEPTEEAERTSIRRRVGLHQVVATCRNLLLLEV